MSTEQVIRAWKDIEYRNNLSPEELGMLPKNPAGLIELSDEDLGAVSGETGWLCALTIITVSVSATFSCVLC